MQTGEMHSIYSNDSLGFRLASAVRAASNDDIQFFLYIYAQSSLLCVIDYNLCLIMLVQSTMRLVP